MLQEIILAFQSYAKAHAFIAKHKLWKWIIIPGLIYMLLFVTGIYYFWTFSNEGIHFIFSQSNIASWLEGMRDSWLNLLVIVGQIIIVGVFLFFYFSFFKFFFLIVGAPVFAYLSEKTEHIVAGKEYPFSWKQLGKDAARGVKIALRNLLWQTVYLLAILSLSVIPVVGWVAPLFAFMIECYYFGFSMLDYSSERQKFSAKKSIELIGQHKGLAIGNGIGFYLIHLVPFVGWVLAPSYAVVAATISMIDAKNKNLIPE